MTTSSRDCQVLVVGAGPTGLVLSAQLLARGIDTRIVDKGNGPARESRAVSVHARTLELLDTMGLAEAFIEHGHRGRRYRMYAGNPEPAQPGHTPLHRAGPLPPAGGRRRGLRRCTRRLRRPSRTLARARTWRRGF
jgi:2-polyprenyl-6-methoxyphenol hydroxylase-like FAD-dependent oxidoreductase